MAKLEAGNTKHEDSQWQKLESENTRQEDSHCQRFNQEERGAQKFHSTNPSIDKFRGDGRNTDTVRYQYSRTYRGRAGGGGGGRNVDYVSLQVNTTFPPPPTHPPLFPLPPPLPPTPSHLALHTCFIRHT